MPGKGKLIITGKPRRDAGVGAAAMSYVRSRAEALGLDRDFSKRSTSTFTFPKARSRRTVPRRHHDGDRPDVGADAHPRST